MSANLHPTMAGALRGFMPPAKIIAAGHHKTPNVPIDPIHFKGMVEHEYTHTNLTLNCYLEYEEGFDGGTGPDSEESYSERISLCYALANGIDVLCLIDEDMVADIESEPLGSIGMGKWNSDYDRGEQRALDRAECEA